MSKYIYSTLTMNRRYATYVMGPSGMPKMIDSVFIQGGANVPNSMLVTPLGVCTKVTDEEYEVLKECRVFNLHVEGGYIRVEDREKKLEKVLPKMTAKDPAAPLTPDDYEPGKEPIVGGSESDSDPEPAPRRRGRPTQAA